MQGPKVTIITVSCNSSKTISGTIESVLSQSYPNIEYIIIDGMSKDGTVDIIKPYLSRISRFVSEPDQGMYDAINKGIRLATGEIIGLLHSDDYFYDSLVIEKVVQSFATHNPDAVYGDVLFVDRNRSSRVVRYYSSKYFRPGKFRFGFMPAHTSFYARREVFERFGFYKTDYVIAADYEFLIRLIYVHRIRCRYMAMPFIIMRTGGLSNRSVSSNYLLNKEIVRACRENGIRTNYLFIYSKYFYKIFQFLGSKRRLHSF